MVNGCRNILIIDDDPIFRDALCNHLAQQSIRTFSADTAADGLKVCARNKIDIVLLDHKLADTNGVHLCPKIYSYNDRTKIIITTATSRFDNSIKTTMAHGHHCLLKPVDMKEMDHMISTALHTLELERIELLQDYRKRKEMEATVIVGHDPCLIELKRMIDLAASSDVPALITGEAGTGKSLVSRAIHYRGRSKNGTIVAVNCAAFPADRIESEFFGHEKDTFSAAGDTKEGFFELAGSGTLVLEEIETLPLALQSRLLGVLDDRKVKRLGGHNSRHVEARIVATTRIDIEQAVQSKRFRDDLYFRLSALKIHVPPLRAYSGDIPELCYHFIKTLTPSNNMQIQPDDLRVLMDYNWPGNVRELRNIIERAIMLRQGKVLQPAGLLRHRNAQHPGLPKAQPASHPVIAPMKAVEEEHIRQALHALSNNHSKTARALGISRSTLIRKMKVYGI